MRHGNTDLLTDVSNFKKVYHPFREYSDNMLLKIKDGSVHDIEVQRIEKLECILCYLGVLGFKRGSGHHQSNKFDEVSSALHSLRGMVGTIRCYLINQYKLSNPANYSLLSEFCVDLEESEFYEALPNFTCDVSECDLELLEIFMEEFNRLLSIIWDELEKEFPNI